MGFFKKLKKRLFTLNPNKKDEKKQEKKEKITNKLGKKKATFDALENSNKNAGLNKGSIENNAQKITKEQLVIDKKTQKLIKREKKKQEVLLTKEKKLDKYIAGLSKSGSTFSQRILELQNKYNKINEEFFEDLEEVLIMSDISTKLVFTIIEQIKKEVKTENVSDPKLIGEIVADKLFIVYANKSIVDTRLNINNEGLNVILMVGVNGSGKTTSIAKIANRLKQEGKKVMIAAGDTFRAGAVLQLKIWAKRLGVEIVTPIKDGAEPSSVVYQSLEQATKNNYDVLIIDTAGRLQNKVNLMNELAKMNKIIARFIPKAPHESLLVIDATTGQNALSQARHFKEVTPISGIVLTKMDGTSKGGIVLSVKDEIDVDVKLLGLGEQIDDLQEFDLDSYIYGLTKELADKYE